MSVLISKDFIESIKKLYAVVEELNRMVPELAFTPDGHMVGSIAQALASYHYDLELRPAAEDGHNALKDGKYIQVRATQADSIALRVPPEHLLALLLHSDGTFEELYNGPGAPVWGDRAEGKQFSISTATLRRLARNVPMERRLARIERTGGV